MRRESDPSTMLGIVTLVVLAAIVLGVVAGVVLL
jgi:hypothetical protein